MQVIITYFKYFESLYIRKSIINLSRTLNYSKYILNSSKFNTSIKIIKLQKIRFAYIKNRFFNQFYNILQKKIDCFEYIII